MCNVPGLRLQEEQQVAVLLRLFVIWERARDNFAGVLKMGSYVFPL